MSCMYEKTVKSFENLVCHTCICNIEPLAVCYTHVYVT